MSETIQLDFQLYVKCPKCGETFDLQDEECTDSDELRDSVIKPLFNNDWSVAECDTTCPECNHEFKVKGVKY